MKKKEHYYPCPLCEYFSTHHVNLLIHRDEKHPDWYEQLKRINYPPGNVVRHARKQRGIQ